MKKGRIYTVHYGTNTETTFQFVEMIIPSLNEYLDLVIINNSKEIDLNKIKNDFITILSLDENAGYFGGAKLGIEKYPIESLDYIIICNNDVQILNSDFFDILDQKLNSYDIIAPSIKTFENLEQNPHREESISISRKYYYKLYFSNYFYATVFNKLIALKKKRSIELSPSPQIERNIFSPHGAFIIFNKSYFKKGGTIDDGYFLYGEEDSVAAIAKLKSMSIGLVPSLRILHQESITTGKAFTKKKYRFQKNAYKYILNKYPTIFNL